MFRGLINDVKSAAGSVAARYATRATVAVPFLIALGFATAAATLILVERFGARDAYFMVAGTFTAIGIVAALIVRATEHDEIAADGAAAKADTADVATDTAAAAAAQIPLALLGALFSSAAGPSSVLGAGRAIGRHLPLVLLGAAVAVLFWPKSDAETGQNADDAQGIDPARSHANGADHTGAFHEAA